MPTSFQLNISFHPWLARLLDKSKSLFGETQKYWLTSGFQKGIIISFIMQMTKRLEGRNCSNKF